MQSVRQSHLFCLEIDSRKEPSIKIKARSISTKSTNINVSTNNTSVANKQEVKVSCKKSELCRIHLQLRTKIT